MSERFFTTNLHASTEKNFFYLALSPFNQEKHTPSAHSRPASACSFSDYLIWGKRTRKKAGSDKQQKQRGNCQRLTPNFVIFRDAKR